MVAKEHPWCHHNEAYQIAAFGHLLLMPEATQRLFIIMFAKNWWMHFSCQYRKWLWLVMFWPHMSCPAFFRFTMLSLLHSLSTWAETSSMALWPLKNCWSISSAHPIIDQGRGKRRDEGRSVGIDMKWGDTRGESERGLWIAEGVERKRWKCPTNTENTTEQQQIRDTS